jgi:hypothetical protein
MRSGRFRVRESAKGVTGGLNCDKPKEYFRDGQLPRYFRDIDALLSDELLYHSP